MKVFISNIILVASMASFANISLADSPLGKTCDVPDIYEACKDAGYQCNDRTAVCELIGSEFLGQTCDNPTVYHGCEAAGFTCNEQTAICENR